MEKFHTAMDINILYIEGDIGINALGTSYQCLLKMFIRVRMEVEARRKELCLISDIDALKDSFTTVLQNNHFTNRQVHLAIWN